MREILLQILPIICMNCIYIAMVYSKECSLAGPVRPGPRQLWVGFGPNVLVFWPGLNLKFESCSNGRDHQERRGEKSICLGRACLQTGPNNYSGKEWETVGPRPGQSICLSLGSQWPVTPRAGQAFRTTHISTHPLPSYRIHLMPFFCFIY